MKLLVYLLFMLSVAFASAGIVLSIRLRNRVKTVSFSSLLYFQAFIATFGFYGIWGQIITKTFLTDLVSAEAVARITSISLLLGMPFIVLAWFMLLKFALEVSGYKVKNWFIVIFLTTNFLLIIALGYLYSEYFSFLHKNLEIYYFIIFSLLYTSAASAIIHIPAGKVALLQKRENRIIAVSITILCILQTVSLYFYNDVEWIGMIFIFTFFAGNSFLPVYLSYGIMKPVFLPDKVKVSDTGNLSFEDFCKSHEISQRESEIIREICNGLSNKEISDKLFITLQTVKDHTHRIYIKTNVKSRLQLMNLVKESYKI
jgi:DNA-binding CsgD family transcriptional regulator